MSPTESEIAAHARTAARGFTPPSSRELRAQSFRRLQIGLFGLAMMILLVALASIIMERARMADSATGSASATAAGAAATTADPLADLGVIPSPESAERQGRRPAH